MIAVWYNPAVLSRGWGNLDAMCIQTDMMQVPTRGHRNREHNADGRVASQSVVTGCLWLIHNLLHLEHTNSIWNAP